MGSLGGITKLLGIALSTASLIKFGKEAIGLASDLAEVDNVVNKAFGNMRSEMDALADSAIKNLGMSRLMAYQTGSTFMSMGKSMIANSEDAKNMALSLTKLTANMASFFNVSQDLASIALKSIYTGETETLKQYGVVMTEVNLKQFAQEQGIRKSYAAMTQSEKVMLRYQYVMNQLSYIGDDFIDTQDSWANQTRILSEQWKELLTILGSGLITVLTPVVKGLNMIVSALINVGNTISNILSSVFGIQMQQMSATAAAAEDVAGGYADAADSMGDYVDATKKAAKAAKGALAPFDDLNVLRKDTSSGSGSGSGGSSGMQIQPVDPSAQTSAIDQIQNKYKKFFDYINKLKDNFLKGFQSSWNKLDVSSQFENIRKSAESIKNTLADIFTDRFVLASVDNFVQTVATSLGSMAASVTSIGATIAENFVGGMAIFLENNSWDIKGYIQKMFDVSADIVELAAEGLEAFANVFSVFGDENGQQITANLIQIFADAFMMVTENAAKFARDIIDCIVTPFVENQDALKTALDGLLCVIADLTSTISDGVQHVTEKITELYDEHIHPFIENVKNGMSELIEKFLEFWNTYIQPILENLALMFEDTYENHLKPVFDNIIEIIGIVIDILNDLWTNILQPIIAWIIENILPIILPIIENLNQNIKDSVDFILDLINFLLSGIKLVFSALQILFTKDTDKVLRQTEKSVKNFVNSIIQMFENMVNRVINGINSLISGFNSIGFDLPDFLGGGSWHPNIPTIPTVSLPRLANGGITTGRTLAEIGEAGREAVLPLENNTGWMDDLASKLASKMPDYSGAKTVVLAVDGKEFARINLPYLQDEEIRLGIAEG
nr:MAG TPA: minor tail protein [Caudoviricetes sp.]